MQYVIILALLYFLFSSSSKKKKRAQQQGRQSEAERRIKPAQPAPAPKRPAERRTVDTRTPQNNVGNKYDEKFDVLAQSSNRVGDINQVVKKQKINQMLQRIRLAACVWQLELVLLPIRWFVPKHSLKLVLTLL